MKSEVRCGEALVWKLLSTYLMSTHAIFLNKMLVGGLDLTHGPSFISLCSRLFDLLLFILSLSCCVVYHMPTCFFYVTVLLHITNLSFYLMKILIMHCPCQ